MDIKTVYEAADVDVTIPDNLAQSGLALNDSSLKKVLLYRAFIRAVLTDIKGELKQQVSSSLFEKLLEKVGFKKSDITGAIDELLEGSFESQITDVTGFQSVATSRARDDGWSERNTGEAETHVKVSPMGPTAGAKAKLGTDTSRNGKTASSEEYSEILIRTFNINRIIEDLRALLSTVGISRLYVFIDDFSELPEQAMQVFVDTILAPLNNWSNELVKFKVAAYPGRIYLGKIDPTKIDEVYLDLFRLYGDRDVGTMEEKATDFTRRLIESRFNHYLGRSFADFCDSDADGVFRHLFFASMANPRILGHLLSNLRDNVVAYGRPIGVRAVQEAASKYYEDKVQPFFGVQKFAHQTFDERASTFSLKELLESVVERARDLRDYKDSRVTRSVSGRTPSSHFHIITALDSAFQTLELNFFVTLYYEQKDRDGNKVSVYALNYGLCQKYSITFGRPSGQREHRLYFVERVFDFTPLVRNFLESNQEIKCANTDCGAIYGVDKLSGLAMYDMLCPTCKSGTCAVVNLSKKYEKVIRDVDPNLLLPATELGILEALFTEGREMVASEIAGELDCSYQLVGKRGRILSDRGLVSRDKNTSNRRVFKITELAESDYFKDNEERDLDLPPD